MSRHVMRAQSATTQRLELGVLLGCELVDRGPELRYFDQERGSVGVIGVRLGVGDGLNEECR